MWILTLANDLNCCKLQLCYGPTAGAHSLYSHHYILPLSPPVLILSGSFFNLHCCLWYFSYLWFGCFFFILSVQQQHRWTIIVSQSQAAHVGYCINVSLSLRWCDIISFSFLIVFFSLWSWRRGVNTHSRVKTCAMNHICNVVLFQRVYQACDSENKKCHLLSLTVFFIHCICICLCLAGRETSFIWMVCVPAPHLTWSCN